MAEKGQFLEIMMSNLQSYLGPEGVDVKLRERFYSEETRKQIGEIDITARGDFGTSKFFWGIECRNRPADGPQGIPWIREIIGKKDQLKPDKMIAVSSTGFTEDAERFAQSRNIDLITIAEPTEEILKEWFQVLTITHRHWQCHISGPIKVKLADPKDKPPAETWSIGGKDLIFTTPPFDMRLQSLDSLVNTKIVPQLALSNLETPVHGMPIEIQAPLSIQLGGRTYPLVNATTEIDAIPDSHSVRALFNVCRRLSDKENIALTSTTKVRLGDEEIVFVILAKKNTVGGGPVDFRFHFYDESGNETTWPEGIAMTMKYHGY